MTVEEFNTKYSEFLEKGNYGLAIQNSKVIQFLDKEFEKFINRENFKFSQIKLKFGYARVYAEGLHLQELQFLEEKINELNGTTR